MSNHKISQETFDETLMENQELFELNDEAAIQETISQFENQGICNLASYLIISHPGSKHGIEERFTRKAFQNHLERIDDCISSSGTIIDFQTNASTLIDSLLNIQQFCQGSHKTLNGTSSDQREKSANMNISYKAAMPFLSLFQTTESIYSLMTLLSVVSVDRRQDSSSHESHKISSSSTSTSIETSNLVKHMTTMASANMGCVTVVQMDVLHQVCKTLTIILTPRHSSEKHIKGIIRDKFAAMERLVLLIQFFAQLYEHLSSTSLEPTLEKEKALEVLISLVLLASAVCQYSERNKVAFVRALKNSSKAQQQDIDTIITPISTIVILVDTLHTALTWFKTYSKSDANVSQGLTSLMSEVCKLIGVLCRYDDFRSDSGLGIDSSYGMNISSSHDHVMEFYRNGIVPMIHEISMIALTDFHDKLIDAHDRIGLACASFSATRVLAVNDDIVQAMVAVGALKVVKLALDMGLNEENPNDKDHQQQQQLTHSSIGLIRNLCGNDEIKTNLCVGTAHDPSSSVLPSILKGMRMNLTNASIQEHGCGTLAAMALRKPMNALRIIQENGPRDIVTALRQHPMNVLVQRQGALAIRNIVSRLIKNDSLLPIDKDSNENCINIAMDQSNYLHVKDVFLDLGTETVLREITGRHQGSVDEAYAALRDLGCQISLVKFDSETGKASSRPAMFGEVKSNFRATYDESITTEESATMTQNDAFY